MKLTDKKAHATLKKINSERNLIGVGGYRNSRRTRCEQNETFNKAMGEANKAADEVKLKDAENG